MLVTPTELYFLRKSKGKSKNLQGDTRYVFAEYGQIDLNPVIKFDAKKNEESAFP